MLTNLPLALVSFLSVDEVIVKGLRLLELSDCCGYLLIPKVTLAFPAIVSKSGTKRLTAKNVSPAIPP